MPSRKLAEPPPSRTDDTFIRANWPSMSIEMIGKSIGRSMSWVKKRGINDLKLRWEDRKPPKDARPPGTSPFIAIYNPVRPTIDIRSLLARPAWFNDEVDLIKKMGSGR